MNTTDLKDFGYRELDMAKELIQAMEDQGLPEDFYDNEVTIMFNPDSGCVFLTNSEYEVAMLNGDDLESFYNLPYSGEEGFKSDFQDRDRDEFTQDDLEYLINLGVFEEEED